MSVQTAWYLACFGLAFFLWGRGQDERRGYNARDVVWAYRLAAVIAVIIGIWLWLTGLEQGAPL